MLQLKLLLPVFDTSDSTLWFSNMAFQIPEVTLNGAAHLLNCTLQVWPSMIRTGCGQTLSRSPIHFMFGSVWKHTHTHTHIWEENYVGKRKGCRDGPVKSRGTRLGWKHRTTTPLQEHGEKRQEDYRMSVTLLGQLNTRMRDHLGITSDSDPWRTRTGQRKDSKLGCLKFRQLQNLQTDLQAVYKQ